MFFEFRNIPEMPVAEFLFTETLHYQVLHKVAALNVAMNQCWLAFNFLSNIPYSSLFLLYKSSTVKLASYIYMPYFSYAQKFDSRIFYFTYVTKEVFPFHVQSS